MIRFLSFGSTDLRAADGSAVGALLAQPKRIGLLLYLCLEGKGGFVRRDRLLALFWPESSEDKARNSLRQAIHQLRRALGEEVIQTRGVEEVGISPEALWCDAIAFEALIDEGKPAEALSLYRGSLLAGLHVADAPGFSDWLDGEVIRLHRRAVELAGLLAERARAGGDLGAALAWARRAVALAPLEEEPARRLISLLDLAGDRGGALAEFEQLATRLRRELDISPSAESRRLVAQLRARPEPPPRLTPLPVPALPGLPEESAVSPPVPGIATRSPSWRRLGMLAVLGVVVVLGLGAVWPFLRGGREGMRLDPRRVVIAPFRVSGADPSLAYLREGMLDLLATKLGGSSTLVAAEPRAVLGAWRQLAGVLEVDLATEDGARVARRLGAGRLLLGSVVGDERRLILSARLLEVDGGQTRADAEVTGPMDSLPSLIDRLAAALLIGQAGEAEEGLAELATASLPALRAWLAGRESYRRGAYAEALKHFAEATEQDSGFALAWLWRADAADWVSDRSQGLTDERAMRLRHRLSPRDQAILDAVVGPSWPRPSTPLEQVTAWERVVQVSPDRAEGWFGLGDVLFHYGRALGADSAFVRAEAAFERAHGVDSAYAAPLSHLLQIAVMRGDRAATARRFRLYAAADSVGAAEGSLAWRVAIATGDSASVRRLRARFRSLPSETLLQIISLSLLEGVGVEDGLLASRLLVETAPTREQRIYALGLGIQVTAATGRFAEFERMRRELTGLGAGADWPLTPVVNALYVDGDSLAAEQALLTALRNRGDSHPEAVIYEAMWRAWHGLPADTSRFAQARLAREGDSTGRAWGQLMDLEFGALRACLSGDPAAGEAVGRLEAERSRRSGPIFSDVEFVLARCHEAMGDPNAALRVIRRRSFELWSGSILLAGALRLEGRYALAAGDTLGAVRAWRHYLALREGADSSVQGRVREVRAALAALPD